MYLFRPIARRVLSQCKHSPIARRQSAYLLLSKSESHQKQTPFLFGNKYEKSVNQQIGFFFGACSQKRSYSPIDPPAFTIEWSDIPVLPVQEHFMENRSIEVEEVMRNFVDTLLAQYELRNANDVKLRVIVAAQMVGSGKTLFGRAFLNAAKCREAEWLKTFPSDAENFVVREIINAEYVEFKLSSRLSPRYTITEAKSALLNTLCNSLVGKLGRSTTAITREELQQRWNGQARITVAEMLAYFQRRLKCKLLIQFDEIDYAMDIRQGSLPSPEGIRRLYEFWHEMIHEVVKHSLCYCSGRSPALLKLGRGYYSQGLNIGPSPSKVVHIFFDRLFQNNIVNIIKRNYSDFTTSTKNIDAQIQLLAHQVYYWTAGIPRLVHMALKYYQQHNGVNLDLLEKKISFEKWSQFEGYCRRHGVAELGHYESLPPEDKALFLSVAQDAIMGIPYTISLSPQALNMLQKLWILGIYTAKTPQISPAPALLPRQMIETEIVYPILPRVVYESLTNEGVLTDPVFARMPQDTIQFINPGPVNLAENWLETKGVECFAYRLKHRMQNVLNNQVNIDRSVAQLFPFLKDSCLNSTQFASGTLNAFHLPKLIRETPRKSGIALDHLVAIAATPLGTRIAIKEAQVTQWNTILATVQKTGLYVPLGKSHSADAYYFWKEREIKTLAFQFKAGKQKLSITDIGMEVEKAIGYLPTDVKQAVIVLVGGFSDNLERYSKTIKTDDQSLGYQIECAKLPKSTLKNIMRKRIVDVVILDEAGQEQMLSSFVMAH